jgi:hypothetical protein
MNYLNKDESFIKRYFNDENFDRLQNDFQFLIRIVRSFKGELEFSLRENYFNLYFRGNNAAKVTFESSDEYTIDIHEKFYPQSLNSDDRFSFITSGNYRKIETTSELLHPLLQKSRLNEIYSRIKRESYSDELAFEQILITDNLDREDLILIDRQVTDTKLARRRMDLLALTQKQENQYQFLVLEVKMGNNPELKDEVAQQLSTYLEHIDENFEGYKTCYERHYYQKKKFGMIDIPQWEEIKIVRDVQGMIVVGGHSVIAREQIDSLCENYSELKVQLFEHKISIS